MIIGNDIGIIKMLGMGIISGELKSIQIGITTSILFYLRLIIEMFREK